MTPTTVPGGYHHRVRSPGGYTPHTRNARTHRQPTNTHTHSASSSYEDTFQLFADLPPPEPVLTPTEPEPPDKETTALAEDPLLQLLRAHARTPTDIIATNLSPSFLDEDYDAELAEVLEQAAYKRYRDRGGLLRYRPSDMGDEAVYINTDWPLWNPELDGSYHTDRERLSPTAQRITSH